MTYVGYLGIVAIIEIIIIVSVIILICKEKQSCAIAILLFDIFVAIKIVNLSYNIELKN